MEEAGGDGEPPRTIRLELPPATVGKVILALAAAPLLLTVLGRLVPVGIELLAALLLTAALDPFVTLLERRGLSRPTAVLLIAAALLATLAVVALLIVPPLLEQSRRVLQTAPANLARLRPQLDLIPGLPDRLAALGGSGQDAALFGLDRIWGVGASVVERIGEVVIVGFMTGYLLLEGERALAWATEALPAQHRARLRRLLPEISRVAGAYLLGQAITSLLLGGFTFAVALLVHLPQPLVLAVVAAVVDILPLLGVVIATGPPVLLALANGPAIAALVLALFIVYHQLESHVLGPRIYGQALGISALAALLATLVGWRVLGIVGIVLALPLAAIAPAVVAIWTNEPGGRPVAAEAPPRQT